MTTAVLTFQNTEFDVVDIHNVAWLRGPQIGGALGYQDRGDAIQKLYARNADEFTEEMTQILDLPTAGGVQPVRIFSLRGAHLLGMLARTERAVEFRRWVLDVLEGREAAQQTGALSFGQRLAYLREVRVLVVALGRCQDGGTGRALYESLCQLCRTLRIKPQPLADLAPALRQLVLAGTGVPA